MIALPEGRVMVMCAPNGARKTKADHPALPLTPAELAATAEAVRAEGASALHLHVRNDAGAHTLDADRYRAAIDAIRTRVGEDLILQITTESVGRYDAAQQMAVVEALAPEAASCALRELCPDRSAEPRFGEFLAACVADGVWVQHILYDETDAARFVDLLARGVIPPEPSVLLVFGRRPEAPRPIWRRLTTRLAALADAPLSWSVCAFGLEELRFAVAAAAMGGHVRIGFENNLFDARGALAESNAAQVAALRAALSAIGLRLVSANDVRAALSV